MAVAEQSRIADEAAPAAEGRVPTVIVDDLHVVYRVYGGGAGRGGGRGGLSGIADARYSEVVQAGAGSWSKTLGVPYPFDERRTVFGAAGQWGAFAVVWAVVLAGGGVEGAPRAVQALVRAVMARRRAGPPQGTLVDS